MRHEPGCDTQPKTQRERQKDSDSGPSKAGKTTRRPTEAQRLIRLAGGGQLFCDPAKVAYARIRVGSHHEVWRVNSSEFRQWLTREYFRSEGKPPGSQPLNEALSLLEAEACFASSVVSPVSVRVAGLDDAIYLDLCDREWTVVKITPAGWTIVSDPPVRFLRTKGMLPLPAPVPGGTVEELRSFVNAPDDENWILIVAWLLSALRPDGPFPILVVQGEQGSGKSTTALRLRQLVDPSSCPLRSTPRSERDLLITSLLKRWLLGTHQGAVSEKHLDYYLDEFTFRFNRRRSRARGLLFYRLLQNAVQVDPVPYRRLVGGSSRSDHNM